MKKCEDNNVNREEAKRLMEELMGGEDGRRMRINAKQLSKKVGYAMKENMRSSSNGEFADH